MLAYLLRLVRCSVALDYVLDGLFCGLSSDLSFDVVICLCPADLDEPFYEAWGDSSSECDTDGKEERFVDRVCEDGFGPYGA